ncbi:MAG TPA: hypothetical protein VF883_01180 [Thermoanaerobaculia bacterium]|jgi:VWFA-related protein
MLAFVLSAMLAAQVEESITVRRVLVDVRVVSTGPGEVADLKPEDFQVTIGGKKMDVESAELVGSAYVPPPREVIGQETGAAEVEDEWILPAGRTIVVFIQTDFTRHSSRLEGHMKFMQYADELLSTLEEHDRVAVFSFDSHLKFRLDFTSDVDAIRAAMDRAIYIDEPSMPATGPGPSLVAQLDLRKLRGASTSEKALRVVGEALRGIPGGKTMIFMGWGLGSRHGMTWEWPAAVRALTEARVSMNVLDTTYADYHDLELGLKAAAEQTGGFYAKTHVHPMIAVNELQAVISGYVELSLRTTETLKPGMRPLEVRVKRRGVRVMAPESVLITR